MHIKGSNVAVIGGSVAGCAAAIALSRAGCSVTVYERSRGGLRDRGAGITIPVSVRDDLIAAGYLDPAMPVRYRDELIWLTRDGEAPAGRVAGRQPYPSAIASWALLWRGLRDRVPAGSYHEDSQVTAVQPDEDGVTLRIGDDRTERYDAVIGADGYRSLTRQAVAPEARITYAGYGLWRGDFPAERLSGGARSRFTDDFVSVGFSGGQGVYYLIPEPSPGRLRQNWAIYGPVPDQVYPGRPVPIPRGAVTEEAAGYLHRLVAEHFPPSWAEVVRRTELDEMSINPMYDVHVSAYASRQTLLAGDAGALARPHTGAGAVKAIQDACALERACRENPTWDGALAVYDAERCTAGNALTDLGRHLGRMRVEAAPDWTAITPDNFDAWLQANTRGWRSAYDTR